MPSRDLARLLLLAGLWGGSFAFIRVGAPALGAFWLAFARVSLAFLALLTLAVARRALPPFLPHWRRYAVIGVVNSALPFALYGFAEQHIGASTAAILNATSPFFGAIVAALWLRDPFTLPRLAGMTLGLAGVGLLVGWQPEPLTAATLLAILACLAAALSYGIASVYAKRQLQDVSSSAVALYSQLTAAIALAPALLFAPVPAAPTPLVAANVLALALASTALAYLLYFRLIASIGPARALTVTFLIPLFGVLWGTLFLGEPLAWNALAGCALILCGTWIAARDGRVRPARPPGPAPAPAARDSAAR
ncbi:MAG TPA: DMT family transporter [Casimicrobiaceae bacterium]|nr:DMT family transporter [Casimicrobiaceae bacterium]